MNIGDNVLLFIGSGGRYGDWDLYPDEYPDKTFKPAPGSSRRELNNPESYYFSQRKVEGAAIRHVSAAWDVPLKELLEGMDDLTGSRERPIGTALEGGDELTAKAAWYARRARTRTW